MSWVVVFGKNILRSSQKKKSFSIEIDLTSLYSLIWFGLFFELFIMILFPMTIFLSNGEFAQHEQLTRKITFSATYTIFMNQIFPENAIFTVFFAFSRQFSSICIKYFFAPKKYLEKITKKKIQKHSYQDSNQRYHYSEPAAITITPWRTAYISPVKSNILKPIQRI